MKTIGYLIFFLLIMLVGCNSSQIHEKILTGNSENWKCNYVIKYNKTNDLLDENLTVIYKSKITQGHLKVRCELPKLGSVQELNTVVKTPRSTFTTGGSSSGSLNNFDWAWDYYDKQTDSALVTIEWVEEGQDKQEQINLK